MRFIIKSTVEVDFDEVSPLYWCADDGTGWWGWGCRETATEYDERTYWVPAIGPCEWEEVK